MKYWLMLSVKIIRNNFAYFEVESFIELIVDNVEDGFKKYEKQLSENIELLMLDADGMIDKDFYYFYNQLMPEATVVIDDCDDTVRMGYIDDETTMIDLKNILTYKLVCYFIQKGLLEKTRNIGITFFGKKPKHVFKPINIEELYPEIIKAYRKLIFSKAKISYPWNNLRKLNDEKLNLQKIIESYKKSYSYRVGNKIVNLLPFRKILSDKIFNHK